MNGLRTALFFSFLAYSLPAFAQPTPPEGFPSKPITIVVHSKPGSGIDIASRLVSRIAKRKFGIDMVIENRPGASGLVAMRYVLSKPADGYTVLALTKSFVSTTLITHEKVSLDSFYLISSMMIDYEALITNRKSDVRTLPEIVEDARKKHGHQIWVGPLVGGVDHIMAMKSWDVLGIDAVWVPYESGSDAMMALLGKHGKVYVGNPGDISGKPDLMVAAVAAPHRLPQFPDAPTFLEYGYNLPREIIWRGFALKKGTPEPITKYIEGVFEAVAKDSEWIKFVENNGAVPDFIPHDEFVNMVHREKEEARKYLQKAGIITTDKAAGRRNLIIFVVVAVIALLIYLVMNPRFPQLRYGRTIFPYILVVLSIFLFLVTYSFPRGKLSGAVGPAIAPRLWLGGLFIFGLWVLVQELRDKTPPSKLPGRKNVMLMFASVIAYIVLGQIIGYFLTTTLFIFGASLLLGYRNIWIAALNAIGFALFAYIVFYRVLGVPLMVGYLF